jgi:hypothetical protein
LFVPRHCFPVYHRDGRAALPADERLVCEF